MAVRKRQGTAGNMARQAQERYGEDLDTLMPRLLKEYRTEYRIAVALGVYPFAVRAWLLRRGWRFVDGQWQQVEEDAQVDLA